MRNFFVNFYEKFLNRDILANSSRIFKRIKTVMETKCKYKTILKSIIPKNGMLPFAKDVSNFSKQIIGASLIKTHFLPKSKKPWRAA